RVNLRNAGGAPFERLHANRHRHDTARSVLEHGGLDGRSATGRETQGQRGGRDEGRRFILHSTSRVSMTRKSSVSSSAVLSPSYTICTTSTRDWPRTTYSRLLLTNGRLAASTSRSTL